MEKKIVGDLDIKGPTPLPQLLTAKEVAGYFRVAPSTVYRWVHDGTLKGIIIGGRYFRIPHSEVLRLMNISGLNKEVKR